MEIEWTPVDKADSYEVTYNNLETEHVRTLTGITATTAVLMDLEPASRYQIYVQSIQEAETIDGESQVFASYTGEPIHGITQIDSPPMVSLISVVETFSIELICIQLAWNLRQTIIKVRVIKSGLQNGTVTVMWEKVEKANEYRVGIVPRDAILGTGKYNGTDLEATLTGLNPTKEYKGN